MGALSPHRAHWFLLAVLIAPAASAEGIRASLSGGLGVAHDGLGIQLEAGAGQWTGFVGLSAYSAVALGARWSMNPDGSGFGIALQGLVARSSPGPSASKYFDDRETLTIIAATAASQPMPIRRIRRTTVSARCRARPRLRLLRLTGQPHCTQCEMGSGPARLRSQPTFRSQVRGATMGRGDAQGSVCGSTPACRRWLSST